MNNKLIARIVAVVMTVAMLGTVSFAATATIDSGTVATSGLSSAYEAQAIKTVLAFVADSAAATAPENDSDIIAIVEADGGYASFSVDPSKVTEDDCIIVLFGGSGEVTDKAVISAKTLFTYAAVDYDDTLTLTVNGTEIEYQNVVVATGEITLKAGKTVSRYGFRLNHEGLTNYNYMEMPTTKIDGSGTVSFKGALIGVPEEVTLEVVPFVEYAE